jgi:hypothetical protein
MLRRYRARLDDGAMACRVTRRHWFPDISQYGKNPNVRLEPVSGRQGVWQVSTLCERCGVPYVYGTDRRTGHIEMRGHIDYTKLPGYLLTEDNGGDGYPMSAEDVDFLRSLQIEEAFQVKDALDARNDPKFKPERRRAKPGTLVMDKAPATEVHFSAAR